MSISMTIVIPQKRSFGCGKGGRLRKAFRFRVSHPQNVVRIYAIVVKAFQFNSGEMCLVISNSF